MVGIAIGISLYFLAFLALGQSSRGSAAGHPELAFWWGVIGVLLAVAGTGALVGSWIHTRPTED